MQKTKYLKRLKNGVFSLKYANILQKLLTFQFWRFIFVVINFNDMKDIINMTTQERELYAHEYLTKLIGNVYSSLSEFQRDITRQIFLNGYLTGWSEGYRDGKNLKVV